METDREEVGGEKMEEFPGPLGRMNDKVSCEPHREYDTCGIPLEGVFECDGQTCHSRP